MTSISPGGELVAGPRSERGNIETALTDLTFPEIVDMLDAVMASRERQVAYWLARIYDGTAKPTLRKSMAVTGTVTQFIDSPCAVQRMRAVLDACGWNRVTVVPVSAAVRAVRRVTTMGEFGAALTQLRAEAGLSLKALAARFEAAKLWGLSKATLSRACNGFTLFQTEDQVVAFVTECGESEATEWVAAWERALADRRVREHQPADRRDIDASSPTVSAFEQAFLDDEVLGEFQVRFTRRHLRAAIVLGAIVGLAVASAGTSGGSNAGVVVLGLAAGLALLEQFRAAAALTSTTLPGAA